MNSVKTYLAAAALGLASAVASAGVVSYAFTGSVTYDEAGRGYQDFAGSFSFDSTALNQIVDPSGSTGSYTGTDAAWSMSLSFDGGTLLDFSSQGFHLNVMNDLGGYDWVGLLGTGGAGTVSAGLYDFTMALFGNAGLPLREGGYTLADFGGSDFRWESEAMLQGVFTSLNCTAGCSATGGTPGGGSGNAVPEPGSWALVSTAFVVVLCLQRRRPDVKGAARAALQRVTRELPAWRDLGRAEMGLGQGLMVMGIGR